jgi:hypothetical protein
MSMRDMLDALKKRYEAEVDIAKATIQVYLDKPVGIGEHAQFAEEMDKQLETISCACDKIKVIDKFYPNDDDIPF